MAEEKTNKELSQKQEKSLSKKIGGKPTPCSGAFRFHKGDVDAEYVKIECKFTRKPSFTITGAVWRKIRAEAFQSGKHFYGVNVKICEGSSDEKSFVVVVASLGEQLLYLWTKHKAGKMSVAYTAFESVNVTQTIEPILAGYARCFEEYIVIMSEQDFVELYNNWRLEEKGKD